MIHVEMTAADLRAYWLAHAPQAKPWAAVPSALETGDEYVMRAPLPKRKAKKR
jgi:hypothetical protein